MTILRLLSRLVRGRWGTTAILLLGSAATIRAQSPAGSGIFAPLPLAPAPSQTLLATGAPGPAYWQNRADYALRATLDTVAQVIHGAMVLRYTSNSPDTLTVIVGTVHALAQDSTAHALPPRLVAQAVIQQRSDNITWPVTSVTIHGRPVSVALDLGSTANLFIKGMFPSPSPWFGVGDSLTFGSEVIRSLLFRPFDAPYFDPGDSVRGLPPIEGVLGTVSLSRYDLVFDGPAGKVLVYAAPPAPSGNGTPAWFPAGMTAADCIPMEPDSLHDFLVVFPVQIQGETIHGMFDSGAKEAVLTMATANRFGITEHSPSVHPFDLKGAHYFDRRTDAKAWSVRSLPVTVGGDSVLHDQIAIIQNMPGFRKGHSNDPRINFGIDSFRDYLLYISYSARQVCLSRPDRKRG